MKEKYDVKGMTCAACQAHVTNAVKKIKGVNDVDVSLLTNSMVVDYDSSLVNKDSIIKEVQNAGYDAAVHEKINIKEEKIKKAKALKKRKTGLIISVIFLILLLTVSMGQMLAVHFNWPRLTDDPLILIPLQILLLIPIVIINFSYFTRGFKALFTLHPNMDSLIALGSTISILYGLYSFIMIVILKINNQDTASYESRIYFESAGTILTLVSLGKYFENKATNKTTEVISKLIELAPEYSTILVDNKEKEVLSEELKINDVVVIKPGQYIPADGVILNGYGNLNESAITGESTLVFKKEGSQVVSGTVNTIGSFTYKVQKVGEDNTLNQLINLVEVASNSKAPIAKLADKISSIFVPVVIGISIITFIIWVFVSNYNYAEALNFAISVLVVSCPCALGLATPVAIMVGTGKGAENGILIKSATAFETLHKITTIVLDKTGTITNGKMSVQKVIGDDKYFDDIASIEKLSEHPISIAITNYKKDFTIKKVDNIEYIPGEGLKATIKKDNYLIGNLELMEKNKIAINGIWKNEFDDSIQKGYTIIIAALNGKIIQLIMLSDTIKHDSKEAIKQLKALNREVVILSGDNENATKKVANELGIDKYYFNVKPDNKMQIIKDMQNEGKIVAMVGDGINDAPSLKLANVGIAIGAGTDIAIDSADIVLSKSDLTSVSTAIRLSNKVVTNIKGNLFWAFFYNIIMIPLAAGALYFNPIYVELNPMIASLAMSLSSITVVLNSLRIKTFKK